jgi:DNA adenine methylase
MLINRYPSPLRYPGGKGKIANYIKLLFIENGLLGAEYVEPYAGGASVALSLLYEDFASHAHINDLNRSVYAFWRAVLEQPDELCTRIVDTPVTVDEWRHQRTIQDMVEPSTLDLAFSTFFLNRTNRSGIIYRGGVIGGQGQDGPWKIDARYDRERLCYRIQKVARFRSRITLTQLDAADLIRQVNRQSEYDQFVYLDPPYFIKGRGLYDNFYDYSDHETIARLVRSISSPWVVSYDAVPEIFGLYGFARSMLYGLMYSAADRYYGSEVMFFSSNLAIPDLKSAAGVTSSDVSRACLDLFSP